MPGNTNDAMNATKKMASANRNATKMRPRLVCGHSTFDTPPVSDVNDDFVDAGAAVVLEFVALEGAADAPVDPELFSVDFGGDVDLPRCFSVLRFFDVIFGSVDVFANSELSDLVSRGLIVLVPAADAERNNGALAPEAFTADSVGGCFVLESEPPNFAAALFDGDWSCAERYAAESESCCAGLLSSEDSSSPDTRSPINNFCFNRADISCSFLSTVVTSAHQAVKAKTKKKIEKKIYKKKPARVGYCHHLIHLLLQPWP